MSVYFFFGSPAMMQPKVRKTRTAKLEKGAATETAFQVIGNDAEGSTFTYKFPRGNLYTWLSVSMGCIGLASTGALVANTVLVRCVCQAPIHAAIMLILPRRCMVRGQEARLHRRGGRVFRKEGAAGHARVAAAPYSGIAWGATSVTGESALLPCG